MKNLKYYIPFIIWTVTIIVLCVLPGSAFKSIKSFNHTDKVVHAVLYYFDAALLYIALFFTSGQVGRKQYLLIFSILLFIGLIIEYVQHNYISNRYWDIGDVLANIFGLCMAVITPISWKNLAVKVFGRLYKK